MIEVEIEDEAWATALPNVEATVTRAAQAALAYSSPTDPGRSPGGPEGIDGVDGGLQSAPSVAEPVLGPTFGRTRGRQLPRSSGEQECTITVLLTDDATIQDLNARFRGKDRPTNVLSFPAAGSAAPHLGDIAVAYDVCAAEAAAQGKPLAHHLMHLTVHGVLHLLGCDHETDVEAEDMEGMERAILATLGVSDPYARPEVGVEEAGTPAANA